MMRKRYLILAVWLIVAGLAWTPLLTSGQTRIAVISDPHVISEELAVNSETWETMVNGSRKLLDYSKEVFDVLMMKFTSEKPDILLISGDLTEDGGEASHNYVAAELAKIEAVGVKVYVIPGNHDIGTHLSACAFAEKYQAFGYNGESVLDENSLSYACEPVPGLILIGIDSHSGALAEGTLSWVCTQAEKARQAGKQVIAMMHHPLFPHITGGEMFIDTYAVADYENVRNNLANAGIKVILTGHFHTSDIAKDWNADLSSEIYDINTGSTISYPCDYRELTLNEDMTQLAVRTYSVTELERVENFSEVSKNRLQTSIKNIVQENIGNETLALAAAKAFIIHAEGDENQSEVAADILAMAKIVIVFKPEYSSMENSLNSIFTDTSNYNDTDRANQTPDRTLDIDLPDLRESVTLAVDGWASFSSARNLTLPEDGLKGYIVTAVSPTSATLQEVTQVPANTGVLLQGESGATYRLANATEALSALTDNLLLPALKETEAPANAFVLACKNDVTGLYPVQQGIVIPTQKAYLVVAEGSSARMISIVINDDTTGITTLSEDTAPAAVYTLQGVRIAHPQKGVYIKNGKLFIAK